MGNLFPCKLLYNLQYNLHCTTTNNISTCFNQLIILLLFGQQITNTVESERKKKIVQKITIKYISQSILSKI